MKPLWVIQGTMINMDDNKGLTEALVANGIPYQCVSVAPFSTELPLVEYAGQIIPYGGTKFINNIYQRRIWTCWFNENFSYRTAVERYGRYMFNSDAVFAKVGDFSPGQFAGETHLFIRPDKDLKEFNGDVFQPEEFGAWCAKIRAQGYEVNENTEIVVAKASRIDYEWRVFVVDGRAISASQYRKNHWLTVSAEVPNRIMEFVNQMCQIWAPAPVFVMDVCSVNDDLSILEFGCFHSCGWYASDKAKITAAVSDYAEAHSSS